MSAPNTTAVAVQTALDALAQAGLGDLILAAGSDAYNERIKSFWSVTAQKKPHSIVQPRHQEDIVQIVQALAAVPDCPFAVRAGGHITWGASNTNGGLLVDLSVHMHGATIHPDRGVVSLLPGTRWREAYTAIAAENISIAGGRTATVGVSGLLTGGGISWYIPRVGFGCDQIVNAEVVLSDGRVVSANRDENSDLWRALKGASAGNFGIVTRFDVQIIPWEGLWGGMLLSPPTPENTREHIRVMKAFCDNAEAQPDSSYIVLWNYEPTTFKDIIITSFIANTKGEENPAAFKDLLAIPTTVRDLKHTNLADFAQTMEQPVGYHNFWFTATFLNDERIMAKAVEAHAAAIDKVKAVSKTGQFSSLCLFQAFPSYYTRLSDERGGNSMGLAQHLQGRNAISLLLSINISEDEDDAVRDVGYQAAKDYLRAVDDFARSVDGYLPWTYVNYADKAQNPLACLQDPENLKAVAAKYDPVGLFQTRTPGFKLSKVAEGNDVVAQE